MNDFEKNVFIAERVMGWTVYLEPHGDECVFPHVDVLRGSLVYSLDSLISFIPYDPLHNISQALDAIECYRLNWKPSFTLSDGQRRLISSNSCFWELTSPCLQVCGQGKWSVIISENEHFVFADTPAAAICEALLLAINHA